MHINKNIAISESGFLFNPGTGDSFSINKQGQEIIRLLQSECTLEEVTNALQEKYLVDIQSIEKDLSDFIYILKTYRIIDDHE